MREIIGQRETMREVSRVIVLLAWAYKKARRNIQNHKIWIIFTRKVNRYATREGNVKNKNDAINAATYTN